MFYSIEICSCGFLIVYVVRTYNQCDLDWYLQYSEHKSIIRSRSQTNL